MHKCIMVKVGGKRNTRKVCKKQVNLCKTGGKYLSKEGGNNNFRETGGKCTETAKIEKRRTDGKYYKLKKMKTKNSTNKGGNVPKQRKKRGNSKFGGDD